MSAAAPWLLVILAALAGTGAGWLHFRSLRPLAKGIAGGDWRALALQLLRLGAMAGFLVIAAQGGASVLLAAASGVMAGRWLVLRAARREAQ